ncbi:MAG: DUF6515 family protein [Pseudomonadota bacterium]
MRPRPRNCSTIVTSTRRRRAFREAGRNLLRGRKPWRKVTAHGVSDESSHCHQVACAAYRDAGVARRGPGIDRGNGRHAPATDGSSRHAGCARWNASCASIAAASRYANARHPAARSQPRNPRPDSSATSITFRGTSYVVSGGQWYERRGTDLVAVDAPAGVLVRELPKGYAMRWIGGAPYFYADGLYYVWRERLRLYEIMRSAPSEETPPAHEHAPPP